MIRTLLFSTLYPSSARPGHGIFVENRLKELLKTGEVSTQVVAPVPWFFSTDARYGEYALMARTPRFEQRNGLDVWHPRYLLPPKVGMNAAPLLLALGAAPVVRKLLRDGFDFDVIDAHYYYPDGVAAALLSRWFRKPFVVTARGSDLNLLANYPLPRRWIRWADARASAAIGVSSALRARLDEITGPSPKHLVMRNGVDLERFGLVAKEQARARLGWGAGPALLSVGNLVKNKGHDIAIESLARLPGVRLVIAGEGAERTALQQLCQQRGLADRVSFAGRISQDELAWYYNAADALVLATEREGWPNVLLESMACGTPVVATRVGGIPEVVRETVAGVMVEQRTPEAFAPAIQRLLETRATPAEVRRYAEKFSWQATSESQMTLFRTIASSQGVRTNA